MTWPGPPNNGGALPAGLTSSHPSSPIIQRANDSIAPAAAELDPDVSLGRGME